MEKADAIAALGALAQDTRLDVFRLLVQAGAPGRVVGASVTFEPGACDAGICDSVPMISANEGSTRP